MVSIASDYAVTRFDKKEFYYGYEFEIDNEWAFCVKYDNTIIFSRSKADIIVFGKLNKNASVEELLIAGIGYFYDETRAGE